MPWIVGHTIFITGTLRYICYCLLLISHPSLGWLYVFGSFPPPCPLALQRLLLLTSKPFELNLRYLRLRKYGSWKTSVAVRYKKSISIIETVISIDYRYIDFLASYFSDRSRGIDQVGDNWRTVNTSANPHISDQLTELRTEYTW